MRSPVFAGLTLTALLLSSAVLHAQQDDAAAQPPIAFAGGQLTITQTEEYGEKTLSFDGKELAQNYVVYFDRVATVADVDVALFDVGDGGNACGPAKVMVWKDEKGAIQRAGMGEDDCGAPVTALGQDAIYFVPWLLPGDDGVVTKWSPDAGFSLAGTLAYAPQPGTGWKDIDPSKYDNMIDAFRNEAVYEAAEKLLGGRLGEMVVSLVVGAAPETTASGLILGQGCVPHNCGGNDGFMAIDPAGEKLYFARMGDDGRPETWPALDAWPAEAGKAMEKALTSDQ